MIKKHQEQKITIQSLMKIFSDTAAPIFYNERDRIKMMHDTAVSEIWLSYVNRHAFRILKKVLPECIDFNVKLFIRDITSIISIWINSEIPMSYADFQKIFSAIYNIRFIDLLNKHKQYSILRNGL